MLGVKPADEDVDAQIFLAFLCAWVEDQIVPSNTLEKNMKNGLYANIHKKQERIKREKAAGKPVEKMRKPGSKGAPTAKAFEQSKKTAKK